MERVERLKKEYNVEVEWRPFELRPGTPPEGIPRKTRPGEAEPGQLLTGHLGEMAKEAGLVMRRAPLTPNSRPALEATEYAKDKGKFEEFHDYLMRGFWEDGKNIGDMAVLAEAAKSSGLDWEELSKHLTERTYSSRVDEQIDMAHRMGINAIPAFIIGRYFFMGAQPYELFKEVVDKALEDQAAE